MMEQARIDSRGNGEPRKKGMKAYKEKLSDGRQRRLLSNNQLRRKRNRTGN
jgi:hypothetical protein